MTITNVYEAKAKLSSLINQALSGKEVYISKAGEPKVQLVPISNNSKPRKPGALKGKIEMAKDFDELPKDILSYFEGKK